jgi:hypothetical protein
VRFFAFLVVTIAFILTACATPSVPPDYTVPLAKVRDNAARETPARVRYFYLAEIDGKSVENAMTRMRQANYGRGFNSMALNLVRPIPARFMVVKLEGRIAYGAPIQEIVMFATMYEANAYIEFAPDPDAEYSVDGELTEQKREVWLQNTAGERVGKIVQR